jgi:hypothetical protein
MQSRSSDEDEFEDGDHPSAAKRRETQRACDVCRRRKSAYEKNCMVVAMNAHPIPR